MFANCKCKLDTCTVELSESEHRSGWKPLASVLGDAAAAFSCVNRVEELVKQFLRGTVAAAFIVRRVVFAKAACAYGNTAVLRSRFCKYRSGAKGKQHCGAEQQVIIFRFGFIVLSSLKLWVVTACKRKKARPAREKPQAKRALCSLSEQPKRTDLSCLSV